MQIRLVAAALALGLLACASPSEPDDRWAIPENIDYAAELQVDLGSMTLSSTGLYWKDLEPGAGDTAEVGANVRVRYTAWLPDATEITTQTVEISPLGFGLAIRAFDEGIVGMRVGGVRQLVAPPKLAWGRSGNMDFGVPPLTTLIFVVERLTTIAHTAR
ncbi:MAG TPA: FKBP-type peptidyl-prolyl cis-trans isomerase [Longimicrobiales bacterium]|nr:FKBP-type peptidyl-prolyl cis-trans isomerase [Longimicrobiales bacterium]